MLTFLKRCALIVALVMMGTAPRAAAQSVGNALSQMGSAFSASQPMTQEDEYYLGRAVAANILEQYPPYQKNPSLTAYLNKICRALTLNSAKPVLYNGYHVLLLDSSEINAFATSGGHIFITRGLASAAASEDGLAAVLAHEIAHIQLGHGLALIKDMKLTSELSAVAERAGATASAAAGLEAQRGTLFTNSVRDMVNTMVKNGYSRTQEFAADTAALTLLAGAGYDPTALVDVLRVLEQTQARSQGGFNTTHPTPALRISAVERALRTLPKNATRPARAPRFEAMPK
ncbi:MAG: M48 family metalloprotease [Treponema sp.]|jgi:predicted Zn-dependent protease|nr:M48 family metalloprotease [Treponema sp.]